MSIYEEIIAFYNKISDDPFHRYKSWEHCYSYFRNTEKINNEQAALQLGFYLASWGMYRGSGYLIWKDYKIHKDLIINLLENGQNLINLDFSKKTKDSSNIGFILGGNKLIKNYYKEKITTVNGESKEVNPSNILSTKILLGIYGCLPAFDRYFTTGLKLKEFTSTSVNTKVILEIINFYRENQKEFTEARKYIKKKSKIEYPVMKLVDMYFWEIGRKEEVRKAIMKKN